MRNIGTNFALGYAPVPEAIRRVNALVADSHDDYTTARLMNCVATLETLRGRFDDARELVAQSRRICPQRELPNIAGYLAGTGARIETLAGNHRRAEDFGRENVAILEEQGLVRYLSSEACFLIDALIAQGKLEEAEALLERARPWAAEDDADALMRQARSRARLEFARGDLEPAESFARQALEHVADAGAPDAHAETQIGLAASRLAGAAEAEARAAPAAAISVAEQRGATVFAHRARALLTTPALAVVSG
jgi:ATP/maltotriose-dependent transcriptional regulator MalT